MKFPNPFSWIKKGVDKAMMAVIMGFIRHALGILGAWLASSGLADSAAQAEEVTGAIMILVAFAWSAFDKTKSK